MTKIDAMFPGVGTPCSDEEIAKEMATLAKANRGTGKELAKNLSLATAHYVLRMNQEDLVINQGGRVGFVVG